MALLSTKYLGLELKSPVIAGSCGMTNSVEHLVQLEKAGAGAVVLKSIFEEQIINEAGKNIVNKLQNGRKVIFEEKEHALCIKNQS